MSKIAQKNAWSRDYVGIIDIIDECCGPESEGLFKASTLQMIKWYMKAVVIGCLVMLQACN